VEVRNANTKAEKTFEKIYSQIKYLPSLPSVVVTILQKLNDPQSSVQDLAKALSYEQSLASRVLKLANSAYYGFPRKVDTLTKAVTIIGYNSIRNIVLVTNLFDSLEQKKQARTLNRMYFWQHSLGCGAAAEVIGTKLGFKNGEEIFLAGLLHDIGKVVLDAFLHDKYKMVFEHTQEHDLLLLEAEKEILGASHAEFGRMLAESWNLPHSLSAAIGYHHEPEKGEKHFTLAGLVHIGDILVRALEIGNGGDNHIPAIDHQTWAALNLQPAMIESIISDFEEKLVQVQSFLPDDLSSQPVSSSF